MDNIVHLQPNQQIQHKNLLLFSNFMNPYSLTSKFKLNPKTLFSKSLQFRYFCTNTLTTTTSATTSTTTSQQQLQDPIEVIQTPIKKKPTKNNGTNSKTNTQNLNESWLTSLTNGNKNGEIEANDGVKWVIGVDPDASGALALLKFDHSGCIFSQVFDSPYVRVSVGKTRRKRLDAKSIVEMLQSFNAPIGTTAYLEQSIPFPRDGKLGWWSGGFGYGLWIGVLVASGFSVVPVPSVVWKKEFELARSSSSKDDSRELAARLFPDMSSMLKRKKDHGNPGRAEALLIAAYGKGLKTKAEESCVPDNSVETLAKSVG